MEVVILDIRQEQPTDCDAVYQVVKEAFADAGIDMEQKCMKS